MTTRYANEAGERISVPFTVLGIWWNDEPIVAAVLEGAHFPVDGEGLDSRFQGRWATVVEALHAEDAEKQAVQEMLSTVHPAVTIPEDLDDGDYSDR